jgi:hypothetical protein
MKNLNNIVFAARKREAQRYTMNMINPVYLCETFDELLWMK